jgi:Trk K+ transport system NAD-binding subunit
MFKTFSAQIFTSLRGRRGRRNLRILLRFLVILIIMITIYSVLFHALMLREGQEHTWFTGFYWTLTVMSTLGFGDITFHTDVGRAFSVLVLLSGIVFLLVLLPFTFIEFFYQPWIDAQAAARAPRGIGAGVFGHVLLTNLDSVTSALIRRLDQYHIRYALLVPDIDEALRLHDSGLSVVVGELDDPEAWGRVGVERAALVVATASDFKNTNVTFTVRALSKDVPIITTAKDEASVDILTRAGSAYVLRLEEMMGQAFARRTLGGDALAHVVGRFDKLLIAEANAHRTPLVGRTLRESRLREHAGVSVVGVWERGSFAPPRPDTRIRDNTILVLAGGTDHLHRYNEYFCIYNVSGSPAVILGGGRVGRATARALAARGVDYRIVEQLPERVRDAERTIVGNAAELEVLKRAGIDEAPTVLVTTHDDDLNIYLTLYCRSLRPDIQVISRATLEQNLATLHRAGADIVMSYAGTGANTILNWLKRHRIVTVAEGLDLFRIPVPEDLAGKTIAESGIRERTGCTVVGISSKNGMEIVPRPTQTLPADADILMIGTTEAEDNFLALWGGRDSNHNLV